MTQRTYLPGDDWLYYKVYCGVRSSNTLLSTVIEPAINELRVIDMVQYWFFVRYSDPDPHLRIRMKVSNANNLGQIIQLFSRKLQIHVNEGTIWNIKIDTYERELERYGRSTILNAEEIFSADSELIMDLINMGVSNDLYFLGIIKSVDSFLDLFGLDKNQKIEFYETGANSFNNEFKIGYKWIAKMRKVMRYNTILDSFKNQNINDRNYRTILKVIEKRNRAIKRTINYLLLLEKKDEFDVPLKKFIRSCIHMFYNKAFENHQRYAELIGYNLQRNEGISLIK